MNTNFGIFLNSFGSSNPASNVYFDTANPNTGGTVFDPNTPLQSDTLYISNSNASTWIWNGSAYVTYANTASSTEFYILGTTIDAGGSKTADLERQGSIFLELNQVGVGFGVVNNKNSGASNGILVSRGAGTSGGYGLQIIKGSTNQLRTNHDGSLLINDAYTLPAVDGTANYFLKTNGAGVVSWGVAGLSYFSEAQSTASPNNTVYANSLTAVASATSADFIAIPKGTGAFIVGHIPDGTATNGNKRGNYAVDINPGALAGAVYCATGSRSFSVNGGASNGTDSIAIGRISYALGVGAINIGGGFATAGATGNYSAILGGSDQIATEATGIGAISLGGGYATGYHSLASGFGRATGAGAVALGGAYVAGAQATALQSFATGNTTLANGSYSSAFGIYTSTKGISSRMSIGTLQDISPYVQGGSQLSIGTVTIQTSGNTASELLAYGGTAIAIILQNNESIRVKGSINGKQTGSTNVCVYDFDCVIVRGTTAGSTVLKISTVTLVWDDIIVTTLPTLSADTSNGGLSVKSGGKATTTIKWTASIYSTESILA